MTKQITDIIEERLERYKRLKDISKLKSFIDEEEMSGATAEETKDLRGLLLALTMLDTSTSRLEKAREQYLRECGDNKAVMRMFDVALSMRN